MTNPAGFKTFVDDAILTAAEINGYLMQGILVFADSTARDTALSGSLAEGRYCYLKDTNTTYVYTGSSWEAVTGSSSPTVSGTTGSPSTSTVSVDGQSGTLYDWSGNGSITCSAAGRALVCVIGGASADNGPNYGNCGGVFFGWITLPASATTITVGANGAAGSDGGGSSVGSIASAPGGLRAVWSGNSTGAGRGFVGAVLTDGYPSNITGSSVTYGSFADSTYGSKNGSGSANAGRVFIFIPS